MDQSQVKCLLQEALYLCPCLTLDLSEEGGRIFAKILFFLPPPSYLAQPIGRNSGCWGSPVSEADTALVSMLSVTTLRVQRLNTSPGIRKQKWSTLDISAWQSNRQGQAEQVTKLEGSPP